MEYRTCKKCGEIKPLTEKFYFKGGKNKQYFRLVCRKCANKQNLNRYYGIFPEHKEEIKRVKFILESQKPKFSFTSYATMTKNKVYDVIKEKEGCYILKDDVGKIVELSKVRFKVATLDEILRSEFE